MRLGRMARSGALTDFILLAIFLSLAYVFMTRKGYLGAPSRPVRSVDQQQQQQLHHQNAKAREQDNPDIPNLSDIKGIVPKGALPVAALDEPKTPQEKLIDPRIMRIPDSRPQSCQSQTYPTDIQVSIIVDFYDYQFYDLKITLGSLLQHTQMAMVSEIIVIDDGTTLDYIAEDARTFTRSIEKVKLVRHEERLGSVKARVKALKSAVSDIVVYLDTNVVVNHGWLPPLVALVQKQDSIIAVPHFDNINDPVTYEYSSTAHNLVAGFSWSMTVRMTAAVKRQDEQVAGEDQGLYSNSPLLRGNAFAVRKSVFEEIGLYDEYLTDNAAANMELSFRAWMCGYAVKSVTCSRVGVLNLNDPLRINSKQSVRRIAELWMGEKKGLAYKNTDTVGEMGDGEQYEFTKRKRQLSSKKCQTFEWYLREVGLYLATPTTDAVQFGLLKCKTGRCAQVADDGRVELGRCNADEFSHYPSNMIFEFNSKNQLMSGGKCLSTMKSAYITATDCTPNDEHQLWSYHSDHHLVNKWSHLCAMHVSDPDPKVRKKRQIVMSQNCKADKSDSKQFTTFDFLPI